MIETRNRLESIWTMIPYNYYYSLSILFNRKIGSNQFQSVPAPKILKEGMPCGPA